MSKQRCNSCNGTYETELPGGALYQHACPPEIFTTREIQDATGKITTPEVRAPRPNPRDENFITDAAGITRIKAAGLGTTPI
jgi:hypothetical protein